MFQDPCRVASASLKLVSQHCGRLYAVGSELRVEFFLGHPSQLIFQFEGADGIEDISQGRVVGPRRGVVTGVGF